MEWKLAAKILSLSRRGCIATSNLTAAKRQTWQTRRRLSRSEGSQASHERLGSRAPPWATLGRASRWQNRRGREAAVSYRWRAGPSSEILDPIEARQRLRLPSPAPPGGPWGYAPDPN